MRSSSKPPAPPSTAQPRALVLLCAVGAMVLGPVLATAAPASEAATALPAWRDTQTRAELLAFVHRVTTPGPDFVPPEERIAVFDQDGTLWTEQPLYGELLFVLDRLKAMAPEHPEWKTQQPYKAALEGDLQTLEKLGSHEAAKLVAVTHSGMTPEQFTREVRAWLAEARHPRLGTGYQGAVYQPMLELLALLRAHDFTIYIVTGGGTDFVRALSEPLYGIPPERVIGSVGRTRFWVKGDRAGLIKEDTLEQTSDKQDKPVNIGAVIGRRPILAVGNSDGDLQMLQYTALGPDGGLAVLLHHDDPSREVAYDRGSKIGALDRALDEARRRGWTVISMQRDWVRIFPERR